MRLPYVPVLPEGDINVLRSALITHLSEIYLLLNGRLHPGDNFDGNIITGTTNGIADTEDAFAHDLVRVPDYFIILSVNKGAVIYTGTTAWTTTNVYLRSNVISVAFTAFII